MPKRACACAVWSMVERYAADLSRPRSASEIARYTGRSERSLRTLSHRFASEPLMSFVRRRRLEVAHEMLLNADPQQTTVTDVAILCGFDELGRFAARYRRQFGQTPSMTLRT